MKVKWSIMASGTLDVDVAELQDTFDVMAGDDIEAVLVVLIEDDVMSNYFDIQIDNIDEIKAELERS